MPRVDTTPVRRARREFHQRPSGTARATSSSPSATKSLSAPVRAPVKLESLPAASLSISTAPPTPTSWRHPAELPYIRAFVGTTHSDLAIIRLLRATALTIPPRPPTTASSRSPIHVHPTTGSPVSLPRGYRLPLLWVTKFLYTSLALVLTADLSIRQREWDNAKFELLHVARLCETLLDAARSTSVDRNWRCPAFDRALRRYWHDWLIMRDEFVRDFWREFGEEEYQGDVLKLNWGAWVLRGHKGFTLTKAEVADGISAEEFVRGLVVDEERGTFCWQEDSEVQDEVAASRIEVGGSSQSTYSSAASTSSSSDARHSSAGSSSSSATSVSTSEPAVPLRDPSDKFTHSAITMANPSTQTQHAEGSSHQSSTASTSSSSTSKITTVEIQPIQLPAPQKPVGAAAGCTQLLRRGHPTDIFRRILAEGTPPPRVSSCVVAQPHQDQQSVPPTMEQDRAVKMEGIERTSLPIDLDPDDDELQLLYPSSPVLARNAPILATAHSTPRTQAFSVGLPARAAEEDDGKTEDEDGDSREGSPQIASLSRADFGLEVVDATAVGDLETEEGGALFSKDDEPFNNANHDDFQSRATNVTPASQMPSRSLSNSKNPGTAFENNRASSSSAAASSSSTALMPFLPRHYQEEHPNHQQMQHDTILPGGTSLQQWHPATEDAQALFAAVTSLRTELGALREEIRVRRVNDAGDAELEARVRKVEAKGRDRDSGSMAPVGNRVEGPMYVHPLAHLLGAEDNEEGRQMDVDVDGTADKGLSVAIPGPCVL
ncbi:hypothetical protein C8R46DRAFT_1190788 [Mycena filopes]|nr:hypothetical protein C8R46DRAFT_1190788 [Mycena filopes]